jgi:hypothetical protein
MSVSSKRGFSPASTDRLIILDLTQWNYKLFIPSWKKEPNSTSESWMQYADCLYYFSKMEFSFFQGAHAAHALTLQ